MAELIEDYSLVSFSTLNVEDKHSMYNLLKVPQYHNDKGHKHLSYIGCQVIDKSNGYCLDQLPESIDVALAVGTAAADWQYDQCAPPLGRLAVAGLCRFVFAWVQGR